MKLRWFGLSRLLHLMQSKFLFLLANDNEVICEFPNYERDSGIFDSIKDIGFTDVNADGVEDIILVIDSIINDNTDDPVVQSNAVIYLTGENEFQFYK